jgi:hypothetical protein
MNGYDIRMGQVERSRAEAERLEAEGKGIADSLHCLRLAADLYAFRDGKYLTRTEDYEELGRFFETLHELASWGGHFGDGNHFSIRHANRR